MRVLEFSILVKPCLIVIGGWSSAASHNEVHNYIKFTNYMGVGIPPTRLWNKDIVFSSGSSLNPIINPAAVAILIEIVDNLLTNRNHAQ